MSWTPRSPFGLRGGWPLPNSRGFGRQRGAHNLAPQPSALGLPLVQLLEQARALGLVRRARPVRRARLLRRLRLRIVRRQLRRVGRVLRRRWRMRLLLHAATQRAHFVDQGRDLRLLGAHLVLHLTHDLQQLADGAGAVVG